MSHWTYLKKGDIVDVIAPGFASKPEDVEKSRQFLLKWGLVPRIPKNLIQKHFLTANTDEKRFGFIKDALEAKDSKFIWCLRGGYGSNRLLPYLDTLKKPREQKLLLGLSDITSLHIYFGQKWNWQTIHAAVLDRMGSGKMLPRYEKETMDMLFGKIEGVEFKKLRAMNKAARELKTLKSSIVGGNLVVLQSTLATPYQLNCDNKILFIEEIGERGYRVDRILEQFHQAGMFKKCKGLIIGEFTGCEEPDGKKIWATVLKTWAERLKIPVFNGMEAGHGIVQRPVPFFTEAVLTGGQKATLWIEAEGTVK